LPKIKDAVIKNLIESPGHNVRNFQKDKIEGVLKGLKDILGRFMTP